jgi:glyoxylase-like metal-dependent hydrolase (beta-lactamase superfamily II)
MKNSVEGLTIARFAHALVLPLKTVTVPPFTTTNTVIYGVRDFVVIDPAPSELSAQQILLSHIDERLKEGHKFLGVFLTHHHNDHTQSASLLRDSYDVPIAAHQAAESHLSFAIDRRLLDGDKILVAEGCELRAIYSPGHADSHMVYYDALSLVLIAGDMITDRGCVLIPPGSGCLKTYLENLQKLSLLKLKAIIPAHGKIVSENPNQFLEQALRHRYQRILSILETLKRRSSALSAYDITLEVYRNGVNDALLPFAQLSVESSLSWLLANGLAEQNENYCYTACNIEEKSEALNALAKLHQSR